MSTGRKITEVWDENSQDLGESFPRFGQGERVALSYILIILFAVQSEKQFIQSLSYFHTEGQK